MTENRPGNLVSGEVNNTTLVMGITTSGKSSLLATMAEYGWETYQRTMFLYTCDGGGYPTRIQALIKMGIIKVWRLRSRGGGDDTLALETTIKASKGWWPAKINPLTGVTDPNVTLVPPSIMYFDVVGPDGTVVGQIRSPAELKVTNGIPTAQLKLVQRWKPNKGFENRGVVAFEGLTSMCRWWEDDLASRQGRLELQGEKGAIGGVVVSGTEKIGGGNRAHVGFSQRRAHQVVANAQGIPNLVLPPVFTALTDEGMDEGLRIIGPKLSGRAAIDEAPNWFGNVVETRMVRDGQGQRLYQLHVAEWIEEGRRHLCKNRAEPGLMPEVFTDPAPVAAKNTLGEDVITYPGAFTQFNLGMFFQRLEGALDVTLAKMTARPGLANAPGMPDQPEYGDVPVPGAATPMAPAPGAVALPAGTTAAPAPGVNVAPPPTIPAPAVVGPKTAGPPPPPVQTHVVSGTVGGPAVAPTPATAPASAPPPAAATASAPTTTAAPAPSMRTVPPPPMGGKQPAKAPAVPPTQP